MSECLNELKGFMLYATKVLYLFAIKPLKSLVFCLESTFNSKPDKQQMPLHTPIPTYKRVE